MMGTLAIMGILALAGIWMYNSAMDKLKANTIINEAQKRAVVVAGQIGFQGRTDPNLGEFSDNTFAGGTFSTDVVTSGLYEQFGIQVSNVPKNVCQNILNSIGATTPIRRLTAPGNPTTALTSCADTNSFSIIYNNDMSSGGNDTTYATTDCSCQTVCGVCIVEGGDTKCVNECPAGGNTCSSNADCSGECVGCVIPSGQSAGTCQSCQKVAYLEATGTQYIDTGIRCNNDYGIELKYQFHSIGNSNSARICGGRTGPDGIGAIGYVGTWTGNLATSSNYFYLATNNGRENSNTLPLDTNAHIAKMNINRDRKIYFDGSLRVIGNDAVFTHTFTTCLFRSYNQTKYENPAVGRIYFFKIWDDHNMIVRDFVPVHAPFKETGKQNCMFDQVSKTLFCNAATGDDFKTNLSNQ